MLLLRLHDMSRIQLPIFRNTMTRASYLKHVMCAILHFFHLVWAFADSFSRSEGEGEYGEGGKDAKESERHEIYLGVITS